jgi:hypothetical protein
VQTNSSGASSYAFAVRSVPATVSTSFIPFK